MNFFKLLKNSNVIINDHGEMNLAYLHGAKIHQHAYLKAQKVFLPHLFFRIISFVRFLVTNYHSNSKQKNKKTRHLFFIGTLNQAKSLIECLYSLKNSKQETLAIYLPSVHDKLPKDLPVQKLYFSKSQIIVSLILLLKNGPKLYFKIRKERKFESFKYFNIIIQSYIFIPYFLDILDKIKPISCITSNDHSVPNRSFLAVAKFLNIPTIYMQHASVSNLFPQLDVDYAFLDGMNSLGIYESIGNEDYSKTTIFLTGQKKKINKVTKDQSNFQIAVAVNNLDDINKTLDFIEVLKKINLKIKIRTHPAQYPFFLAKLHHYINNNQHVIFSDPAQESLDSFFTKSLFLVAGNSSIHLEAVIAGLPSYFYNFSNNDDMSDYYGYIKLGLISQLPTLQGLSREDICSMNVLSNQAIKAAKHYSSTFHTKWEGREGELTAQVIKQKINKENTTEDLFSIITETKFKNSYQLKEDEY